MKMDKDELSEKEMWAQLPKLDPVDRAEMLLQLSQKAAGRNRPKDALALANQAGDLLQSCAGPETLVLKALSAESEYLAILDRKDEAILALDKVLEISRQDSDPFIDDLLRKQAAWFGDLGDWESALNCQLEAIQVNEIDGDQKWLARSFYLAGTCYQQMFKCREAIEYYKKARTTFKAECIYDQVGWCDLWIAECYTQLGAGEDALSYAVRALELSRMLNRSYWITCSLIVVGKANYLVGQYQRAEEALDEANALLTSEPEMNWSLLVEVNEELIKIYQASDRFDLADEIEGRVRTIKEIMED